jgi:hypothetical protein
MVGDIYGLTVPDVVRHELLYISPRFRGDPRCLVELNLSYALVLVFNLQLADLQGFFEEKCCWSPQANLVVDRGICELMTFEAYLS